MAARKKTGDWLNLPLHGGDITQAESLRAGLTGEAEDPHARWLDLSTGINPVPYPLPPLRAEDWRALPTAPDLAALLAAARKCYRVPPSLDIVAGPGSQALIQLLPTLFDPAAVAVLAPTYGEHERAWGAAGHRVRAVATIGEALRLGGHVVLVRPNNPDGRRYSPEEISTLAVELAKKNRWLVVDEAFCDLDPEGSAVHGGAANVVVLRSFGKFFGLAGLRLGFAVTAPDLAARIAERLGAWAVSGPAIAVARAALGDFNWQRHARAHLDARAARLDRLAEAAGLEVIGGTALFRLAGHGRAADLFAHLLTNRIYVRRFAYDARLLRFGLPASEDDERRLSGALQGFAGAGG